MTARFWNELIADIGDYVWGDVPGLAIILFLITLVIAVLWYTYPAWLPSNWRGGRRGQGGGKGRRSKGRRGSRFGKFRFKFRFRFRLRWRRRSKKAAESLLDLPDDHLPDLPASVLALTADQLAAAGRYAEAVRERLRAIVKEMIERGVIEFRPGWTVTELGRAASRNHPPVAEPVSGASTVFSDIWYGMRSATMADDQAMREHATRTREALAIPAVGVGMGNPAIGGPATGPGPAPALPPGGGQ